MTPSRLIDGLRDFLRMETLDPDADGVSAIVFDDGLEVELLALSDKLLLLRANIADIPDEEDAREEFYKRQLQYNLLALRDQSASLSLDSNAGRIRLHRVISCDRIETREFYNVVEDFVNTLEWWRNLERQDAGRAAPSYMPHNMLRP